MTTLEISTFASEKSNTPQEVTVSWDELCSHSDERTSKSGPAWSPAKFNGKRSLANVVSLSCLVFDLDEELTAPVAQALEQFEYIAHTTHTPGRWRIIIGTTRPHLPSEHKTLWDFVNKSCGGVFDAACTDVSRLYYNPTHRPGQPYERETAPGKPLDVDAVLSFRPTQLLAPKNEGAVDIEDYREQVKDRVKNKVKREQLLKLLSMSWGPTTGGRNALMHSTLNMLASVIKPRPSLEQVSVIIDAVLANMDCAPEGEDEWRRTFKYSYSRALARLEAEESEAKLGREAVKALEVSNGIDSSWKERLLGKIDDDGNLRPRPLGSNVYLILQNDPAFKSLRFNVVTREVEAPEGPLKGVTFDNVDTMLSNWLQTSEYRINLSRMECFAQVKAVVAQRPYDPLRSYLEGLKWDGVPRISNVLREHCGVEAGSPEYVNGVCRKFFISAVARGLNPGSQVDTMLILQGLGGVGKTTFVRALGGEFAAETTLDIHNKDGLMAVTGKWLVEQAEMSSMRKADEEAFRSFVTRTTDSFRPPYGRTIEHFPRRCVFIGTSNDDAMLKDVDGARRYWPVRVGKIDVPWLTQFRDQLWAEAVVAYRAGEQWWFTDEERVAHMDEVDMFQQSDSTVEVIQVWYNRMQKDRRPAEVTMRDLLEGAFGLEPKDMLNRSFQSAVGKALKTLRFAKHRRTKGNREWYYVTPPELLTGEVRRSNLQLVTPPPAPADTGDAT